jgi:hypothetical protein
MYYSTNGTTWTSAGANFLTSFAADADNNGFTPAPGSTIAVNSQLVVSVPITTHLYLAWNYSVTTGTTTSNAQALGVDDVSVAADVSLNTDSFRSKTSGDWGNVGTWESSHDGTTWFNATLTPDNNANTITVQTGHTVTVTANVSEDQLTVNGTLALAAGLTNLGPTNIASGGILQINSGGFISNTAPVYAAGSSLVYNASGNYGVGTEWTGNSTTAGLGVPAAVTVQNSTTVNMPASYIGIAGSINILSGAVVLTTGSGLFLTGDFTRANTAVFNSNNQVVVFNGTGTQNVTVTGGGTETFSFLLIQNTSVLKLASGTNMFVNAPAGLTLSSTATDCIDLNGQTMTMSGGSLDLSAGARGITSSVPGGSVDMSNFGLNVTNGGSLTFKSNVTVKLNNGFDAGAGLTTINGTLQINNGGFVFNNAPIYGTSSLLQYNSGTDPYNRSVEWTTATSGPGFPHHVQVSNNTVLNYPNGDFSARAIGGNLTVDGGSALYMDYGPGSTNNPLTVAGNVLFSGNISLGDGVGGDMKVGGDWTQLAGTIFVMGREVSFNGTGTQTLTTINSFDNVRIAKTAGSVVLNSNVQLNTILTFDAVNVAHINTGSNVLIVFGSAGSEIVRDGSGHVIGFLRRGIGFNSNPYFYPVGTTTGYTPVNLTFNNVMNTGKITVKSNDGNPYTGDYALSATKFLNRYWSVTNDVTTFTSVSASFDYLAGDLSGLASAGALKVAKFDAPSTWTYPATTATAYNLIASGLTSFSDFTAAECEPPTITIDDTPTICQGTTSANLVYTATTGGANQYSIDFDAAAELALFVDVTYTSLPASPIVLVVPGMVAPGTYDAMINVKNSATGCEGVPMPITVMVNTAATANAGGPYTTCGTTPVSITATANGLGLWSGGLGTFAAPASLSTTYTPDVSEIGGTVNLTWTTDDPDDMDPCPSVSDVAVLTVNIPASITLGASPAVCLGVTSADLPYTAVSGNQYSIDYDAAAETAGFVDVAYTAISASPIALVVPGAAPAAVYNATIKVKITATGCESTSTGFTVTVNPNATAGSVNGTSPLCIGATATYTSTGDAGGVWSSTNMAVATVIPGTGVVTALSAGTTDITYTVSIGCTAPVSAFKTLTVNPNATAGTINGTTPICIGATTTYTSTGDAGGVWSSTNMAVATVIPGTGVVTALSAGTTDITYTVSTGCAAPVSAFKTLTVSPNVTAGTVNGTSPLCIGATATYTTTGDAGGAWTSTDPGVATVSPFTGFVTAVSAGTTDITYTISTDCNTTSAFKTLTVTNPEINLTGLGLPILDGDITPDMADDTEFGSTAVSGGMVTHTFTVGNSGSTALTVSGIVSSDATQFALGALTPASPIPAGMSATFTVTFDPSTAGLKTATITVNNDDCSEAMYDFAVQGTGTSACPTITFTATPSPFCTGGTPGQIAITAAAGGLAPYTYSIDNGMTYVGTATFTGLAAGVYPVIIQDANGCLSGVTSVTITTVAQKTANAGADWTTCINGIVQLSGSIGGGASSSTWTDGGIGGTFQNANALVTKYTPPSGYNTTITLTLTTDGPCAGTDNLTINFATPPALVLTATGPATATCGDVITVIVSATSGFIDMSSLQYSIGWDPAKLMFLDSIPAPIGGFTPGILTAPALPAGQMTYAWFDGSGVQGEDLPNGSTLLTLTFKVIGSAGFANVTIGGSPTAIEATNSQFCILPYTLQNNVNTALQSISVGITGTTTICNGQSTTLTATGGTIFLWSTGATGASITVSPMANTTYSVIVTNANGCSATATQLITVNPLPVPMITGTTTICQGTSTTLTASGGASYSWTTGDLTAATTVSPASTTTYTVTATSLGCSVTASVTVTVNPLETVNAGPDQSTCLNGFVHLAGTVGGGASGGTWTSSVPGGSFIPNATTLAAYYMPPSGYSGAITMTLTTNGPCPVNDNMTINYGTLPPLVLTAAGPATATCGDLITFNIVSTSGFVDLLSLQYSLNWDFTKMMFISHSEPVIGTGTPDFNISQVGNGQFNYVWAESNLFDGVDLPNGFVLQTVVMKVLVSSGSYGVTITGTPTSIEATNAQLCVLPVTLNTVPTAFSPITVTCPADMMVCFDTPVFSLTGGMPSGGTYTGTGVSSNMFNAASAGVGTHTITYLYTAPSGCFNSCTFTITVTAKPTVAISGEGDVCEGGSVTLSATISGGSGTTIYTWKRNGVPVGGNTAMYTTDDLLPAGLYSYTVAISQSTGCSATSSSVSANVVADPTVLITGAGDVCEGGTVTLTAVITGGTGTPVYTWKRDGTPVGSNSSTYTTDNTLVPGNYSYTVEITQASGCSATSPSVSANVVADPTVLITGAGDVCEGGTVTLTAVITGGTGTPVYTWKRDGTPVGTNSPTYTTDNTLVPGNYTYTVEITQASGCSATSSSVSANVVADPTVLITGAGDVCEGGTVTLTAVITGGTGTPVYTWKRDGAPVGTNSSTYTTDNTLVPGNYTYTVEITQASGCSATSPSVSANVVADPTVLITGAGDVCEGGTVTLTAVITGGTGTPVYTWKRNGTPVGTNSSTYTTDNTLVPGNYSYTVEITQASGCSAVATPVNANVVADPTVLITGAGDVCEGGTVTLTAVITGGTGTPVYTWKRDGTPVGTNSSTYTTDNTLVPGNYTYTVEITQASGCSATSSSVSANVVADPTVLITGAGDVCEGGTVTLTAVITGGTGTPVYTWKRDGTPVGTNSSTYTTDNTLVPGNYSYTVEITQASGCSATSSSVSANVVADPTVLITGAGDVCEGGTVTLTAVITGGTGTPAYTWKRDGTPVGTNSSTYTTDNTLVPGNYTYTVEITQASGCSATSPSVSANVVADPTVLITGAGDVCEGGTVTLTAVITGGTGTPVYTWKRNGTPVGSNSSTYTTDNTLVPGNYTYTVEITQASGCSAVSPSVSANVVADPTVLITGAGDVCEGGTVTLTAVITGGTGTPVYTWKRDGTPVGTNSSTYTTDNTLVPGNYTYTVEITQASGCSAVSPSVSANVVADPTVLITGAGDVCEGGTVTLTAVITGGTGTPVYTWKRNGTPVGTNSSTYTTDNTLVPGNYSYTVEITQASGCSAVSPSVSANVVADPTVLITGAGDVCEGGTVTLTAVITGGTGTPVYTWKRDGTPVGTNSSTYTTDNTLVPGNYTYTVEITQASGCSAVSPSVSANVVADPTVLITGAGDVCEGGTVTLTAVITGGTGTPVYTWKRNGTPVGTNSSTYTTDNTLVPGNYSYTVEITQASGCSATSSSVSANVVADPTVLITGAGDVCEGGTVTLTAVITGGTGTPVYTWKRDGTPVGTNSSTYTTDNTLVPGNYSYTVEIAQASGCSAVATPVNANVVADPTVLITGAGDVCEGGTVTLTAVITGGTGTPVYTWKRDGTPVGSNSSTYTTDNTLVPGNYSYTVEITQASGCSATSPSVSANVVADPTVLITGAGDVCEGGTVTLTAVITGGTGTPVYTWKRNGTPVGSNSSTYTTDNTLVPGNYTYTVEITQASGCSAVSPSVSANVVADPTVLITGAGDVCEGGTVTLTAVITGGTGTPVYTWKRDGTPVGSNSSTYTTDNTLVPGNYSYTVEITQASGCSAVSPSVSANVAADPTVLITGAGDVCEGGTVTLTAVITGGTGTPVYTWKRDGTPVGSNSSTYTTDNTLVPGNYTYTVEITQASGCSAVSPSVSANVFARPTAIISGSTSICIGQSATLTLTVTGSGVISGTLSDGTAFSGTAPTILVMVSPTNTTIYTVVTLNDGNSCQAYPSGLSGSATVTVYPLPAGANDNYTICSGAAVNYDLQNNVNTLGNSVASNFSWAALSNNPNITGESLIPVTGDFITDMLFNTTNIPQAVVYRVTPASDPGVCAGPFFDVTVTVNPIPTALATDVADPICSGSQTNITVSNPNNVAGTTYNWSAPVTAGISELSSAIGASGVLLVTPIQQTLTNTTNAPILVTFTITPVGAAPTSCTGTPITETVLVNPTPAGAITASAATTCNGTPVMLTFTATAGAGNFDLVVNGIPYANVVSGTVFATLSPAVTTTYTLTSIVDKGVTPNCSNNSPGSSVTVTVTPRPTAVISGTATICNGASTNLSIAFTGTAPFTYSINGGAPVIASTNPEIVSVSPSSNTTYTVTSLTDAACAALPGDLTGSAVITVNPRPTAVIIGTATICNGASTNLSIAFTGTAPFTYSLNGGSPVVASSNPEIVSVSPSATVTYLVTSLTDANCTALPGDLTGSAVITVNPRPTAVISGTAAICNGSSTNLSIAFTGTAPFTYSINGGAPVLAGSNPQIVSVSPAATVTYLVTSLTDANCTAIPGDLTGSAVITVNPRPTAVLSGTTTICAGLPATLTLTVTGSGTISGTLSSGTVFSGTAPTITVNVTPAMTTTYTIATLLDANCSALPGDLSGTAVVTVTNCSDITGKLIWEGDRLTTMSGVNSATVTLSGSSSDTDITGIPGLYTVTGNVGTNFIVTPTKNKPMPDAINGLSAADASRIQQHVIGTFPFSDPYKMIAADANKSNAITAADASLIQQAVLGSPPAQTYFSLNTWRFVPKAYVFPVPTDPWSLGMAPYFPESITLNTGASNQDFIGMKLGDVNISADPANFANLVPDLNWKIEDRILDQGVTFVAEFQAEHFDDLLALQFGLQFDPTKLQFLELENIAGSPLQAGNFGLYKVASGEIRAFLAMSAGMTVPAGTPTFRVKFKVLQGGDRLSEVLQLSDAVLEGEAYSTDYTPGPIQLLYHGVSTGTTELALDQLQLMQNQPNPFTVQTSIGFVLPEACEAQIRVWDVSGRLVAENKAWFARGHNQMQFRLDGYAGEGVLYYELVTPYGILSRKMILIKE